MSPRPEFTPADAERAGRALRRDPAASAYGDSIRVWPEGRDPYAREAARLQAILDALTEAKD